MLVHCVSYDSINVAPLLNRNIRVCLLLASSWIGSKPTLSTRQRLQAFELYLVSAKSLVLDKKDIEFPTFHEFVFKTRSSRRISKNAFIGTISFVFESE